ncbi:hypothetical protein Goarm_008877, partial [Gossypium armourianum]|nr:hypothetical protein [Gossypium armourianum]
MKRVDVQVEPKETCGRSRKDSRSRDMLSALEGQMTSIEKFMDGMKEIFKIVEGCTIELDSGAIVGKGMLRATLKCKMDVSKPKEFKGLGVKRLTKVIIKVKFFVKLGSRKDKFESSRPKEANNGKGHREEEHDKNGHGGNGTNGGNRKLQYGKRKPNNNPIGKENENKLIQYFLCCGSHMMRDYSEHSKRFAISKEEKAKPDDER